MSQYDQFARDYAQHSTTSPYNVEYERPAMAAQLPDLGNKSVLDAGCASGEFIPELLERGANVTALDASAELLSIVQERFGDRVVTVQGDLNAPLMVLQVNSFDLVMSSLTIHYIEDLYHLFSEFRRVLKPGGGLLFSTHHPSNTWPSMVEDYFLTQPVIDHWNVAGREVDMQFFHRPLQAICDPLVQNGFELEAILEPPCSMQPGKPWFLIVKARKG